MKREISGVALLALGAVLSPAFSGAERSGAVEFCLVGEFDLGARLQGLRPKPGELSPARWCVVTEDDSARVHFYSSGRINPDVSAEFAVSYLPPDRVRIVNRDSPPDIEFAGAAIGDEALRHRRIDPYRLVEELERHPEWVSAGSGRGPLQVRYPGSPETARVTIVQGRLELLQTHAAMPLRGRVPVEWVWYWPGQGEPAVTLRVDGSAVFQARGERRQLDAAEAEQLWQHSQGMRPRNVPGSAWPARVAMEMETLAEGVYWVTGVRTGFHHVVVDTAEGLVVGDAPAGWVELPQIPPADLVPGLGVSGLSERFIDFLGEQLPGRPLRAVVLTHAHDDHAGGARAFAASGATVYAPFAVAGFLEHGLNRAEMPPDRLSARSKALVVTTVEDRRVLDDPVRPIEIVDLSGGPHVASALGLWVPAAGYFFQSDLHVAHSEADAPDAARAASECWFAAWAAAFLPADAVVLSSHGSIGTPVWRLARYLDSEACR